MLTVKEIREYARLALAVLKGEKGKKVKCPLCGAQLRQPFGHFFKQHPKADLALLICKLLDVRPF